MTDLTHAQPEPTLTLTSSPILQGERVAFTGTLASMTHARAAEFVEQMGGQATEHVSRQTTMLVVGEEGWPLESDGTPSAKLRDVDRRRREGQEIRIVNESDWLQLLGLMRHRDDVHRLYTPAMLSSLLGLSVHVIRRWEQLGLIRAVQKVHRLPFFDFCEVTSARRLSELMDAGVPREEIEQSLKRFSEWSGQGDRSLEQLQILGHDHQLTVRDDAGLMLVRTGQRLLNFDAPQPSDADEDESLHDVALVAFERKSHQGDAAAVQDSHDWFVEGCRAYGESDIPVATDAFRLCLMREPHNAEAHFHLAECLYLEGHVDAALERFYVAVENDHQYLEAWTQIGCLHREQNDLVDALDAFDIALDVYPDFADAHFHSAETLFELGRIDEAVPHWQRYLEYDDRGPWADMARHRLHESTSVPATL